MSPVDKVAVESIRADGTVDQTPGATYTDGSPVAGPFEFVVPDDVPEVPASPTAQNIVDALVTLGLVTQAGA
jgi:hypothetical protein